MDGRPGSSTRNAGRGLGPHGCPPPHRWTSTSASRTPARTAPAATTWRATITAHAPTTWAAKTAPCPGSRALEGPAEVGGGGGACRCGGWGVPVEMEVGLAQGGRQGTGLQRRERACRRWGEWSGACRIGRMEAEPAEVRGCDGANRWDRGGAFRVWGGSCRVGMGRSLQTGWWGRSAEPAEIGTADSSLSGLPQ